MLETCWRRIDDGAAPRLSFRGRGAGADLVRAHIGNGRARSDIDRARLLARFPGDGRHRDAVHSARTTWPCGGQVHRLRQHCAGRYRAGGRFCDTVVRDIRGLSSGGGCDLRGLVPAAVFAHRQRARRARHPPDLIRTTEVLVERDNARRGAGRSGSGRRKPVRLPSRILWFGSVKLARTRLEAEETKHDADTRAGALDVRRMEGL